MQSGTAVSRPQTDILSSVFELGFRMQNRTALANTPGSLFFKECEEVFAKGDFLTLLKKFLEQTDVLFTKTTNKGGTEYKAPVNHIIMEATWLAGCNVTQVAGVSQELNLWFAPWLTL